MGNAHRYRYPPFAFFERIHRSPDILRCKLCGTVISSDSGNRPAYRVHVSHHHKSEMQAYISQRDQEVRA